LPATPRSVPSALHPKVENRIAGIAKITIRTHEAAIRIVPLLFGQLTAEDYEDARATDPRIDALRAKMLCVEDPAFTGDYHDPEKRSIANGITVEFADGSKLAEVVVEYPPGHKRRRAEGTPLLEKKFITNLHRRFASNQRQAIIDASLCLDRLEALAVNEYVDLYVT
jgi:2-methylcitrate dehydratase